MATPTTTTNTIEQYIPYVKYNGGIATDLPVYFNNDVTITGTTTIAGISLTDLTVTGNTTIGNAASDTLNVTGITTLTSANASAFAVGRQGATAPAFVVDAATASSATGIKVTAAAAAGGVALAAVSSGTDESLTINAKGTGTVTINGTATGNIVLGAAMTGVSSSMTGGYTAKSGTAVPATAGAVAAGAPITMFSTGIKIWVTSDAPTHSGTKGDLCINTGGSSSSTRLFINNGTTTWIAVTTAS